MDADAMRGTLESAVEDFNTSFGDTASRERYFALYEPDVVLHGYPPGVEGLEGARAFYDGIWTALPDGEIVLEDSLAEDDLAAARFVLRGTHTGGELMGVPASGASVEVDGQSIFRFSESGRVAERWQALDTLTLLTQIGAIPAPA